MVWYGMCGVGFDSRCVLLSRDDCISMFLLGVVRSCESDSLYMTGEVGFPLKKCSDFCGIRSLKIW